MADAELPPETAVGRVELRVKDLDAVRGFYEDVVGLEVRHAEAGRAALGAGGAELLRLVADPDAPERERDETGLFHTAFRVPTRSGLGEALARIEREWDLTGASDHRVSEALYLSDPEDNGVEVYCDRPRETWPVADDGRVAMDTRPLDLDGLRAAAAGDDNVPGGTDVGHVHLEVSAIPDVKKFYVDTLGLGVRQTYGSQAVFVAAGHYHHHVGANTWNGRSSPPGSGGLEWFELVVPDREALEAVRERVETADRTATTTDDTLELTDPDGIVVRIRASGR
jgi:catechol 2,3-dioxygenase